ncbi:MAG: hypothetical protein PUP91_15105 [Rhizonema sp. PD37]|nr:hypothetical protein [Rhizonema sp. PD37]
MNRQAVDLVYLGDTVQQLNPSSAAIRMRKLRAEQKAKNQVNNAQVSEA